MKRAGKAVSAAKPPRIRASVVAAYREGLSLAGIAIACEPAGVQIVAIGPSEANPEAETITQICWWCLRAADAERITSAAARRMRRLESRAGDASLARGPAAEDSLALSQARDAMLATARRLNVLLRSDDEIADEAGVVAASIDAEVERMQQSGELKSVNQAYRKYRIEATGRGERIMSYAEWMRKYKEDLVREAASALRHVWESLTSATRPRP
jgi:hypothetical protein